MSSKENENRNTNTKMSLKLMPKGILCLIIALIIMTLVSTGTMIGTVFTSKTKTTKFGLEDVGELVTQTAHLTVVEDNKVNKELFKKFKIPFTESRQVFSYDVDVDASVDFAKISIHPDDVTREVIVKLPHSKIYKATLDLDSQVVYLDEGNIFSRINLTKQNEALKDIKEQGIADAKDNGILEAADKNAIKLIESLIKSDKKYNDYKITYKYLND